MQGCEVKPGWTAQALRAACSCWESVLRLRLHRSEPFTSDFGELASALAPPVETAVDAAPAVAPKVIIGGA